MDDNEAPEMSPSRPKGELNPRTTEVQNDIPFRSAGGASTGSFATPRMQHHFVPSSPLRFHSTEINDSAEELHDNSDNDNGNGNSNRFIGPLYKGDEKQEQHYQNQEIEEGAKSPTQNNGEIDVQKQNDSGTASASDNEASGSISLDKDQEEDVDENILIQNETTLNGLATNQEQIQMKMEQTDLTGSMRTDNCSANGSKALHLETIEQELNDSELELNLELELELEVEESEGEDCISKIDVSFCSDFSCEVEKLTLLQKKSDTTLTPTKSQLITKEDEGISSSSESDWSDDEVNDSSEDSNHERTQIQEEDASGSEESNQSSTSSSSSDIISDGNGLGAMRSPWMKEYESSVESSTIASSNNNASPLMQGPGLGQGDSKRMNEEGNDAMKSPWTKYLHQDGHSSSGDISSISNHSLSTNLSSSTCASMQSPTLQHLEYLARNSTSANVASFTRKGKDTGRVPFISPLQKASERITLNELHDIYGCKTRRDAMQLALDQSICLGDASSVLVDLLFEYIQRFCDASTQHLFEDDDGNAARSTRPSNSSPHNGLSLPASAIGWLSSYLYPDEGDHRYHQQWEGIQEEYCLPNSSPAPQLQSKLTLLKVLLQKHVTHLRITNTPWPGVSKKGKQNGHKGNLQSYETPRRRGRMLLNFDADSVSAFIRFYRLLQNQPRVDMRLFSQVQYVSFEGIPPEWIHNLRAANRSISRLSIQKGCLLDLPRLLEVNEQNRSDGHRKKDLDISHEAVFEHGIYDSILQVANQQHSPVVKVPMSLQETIKSGNPPRGAQRGKETNQNQAVLPTLKHLILSACSMNDSSLFLCRDSCRPSAAVADSVLSHLRGLETIDISHNEFTHAKSVFNGLSNATNLAAIDLSYNKLVSMDESNLLLGNLKVLILANNNISDACGLDRLYSLEILDMKYNRITNLCDVSALAKLPNLTKFDVEGNPLITKGKSRYRACMLSLFKDSRIQDNGIGLTYRQVMNLLPTLDGTAVTKKEMVMLKYLSFSQSFQQDCAVGSDQPTQHDGNATVNSYLCSPFLRPFAEDYHDEFRFESTSAVLIPTQPPRRRVVRKAAYKPVIIGSDISEHAHHRQDSLVQTGEYSKYSKVKLQRIAPLVSTIPSIYLSIETVVKTISNHYTQEHAGINSEMISNIDNGENIDASKSGEVSESSLKEYYSGDSIVSINSEDGGASQGAIAEACGDEASNNFCGEDSEITDCLRKPNFVDKLPVEIIPSEDISVFHHGGDDELSTCPTDIVKNSLELTDDGHCADAESAFESTASKIKQFGFLNPTNGSATNLSKERDENNPPNIDSKNIDFAAIEKEDKYDGPDSYSQLFISEYYELYFRCFVFRSRTHVDSNFYDDADQEPSIPKVQLYQSDRDLMIWALNHKKYDQDVSALSLCVDEEKLISINRDIILPCGVAATARIQPISSEARGSKGAILSKNGIPYSISEGHNLLFCLSNRAVYLIPDFLDKNSDSSRRFPSAISTGAQFSTSLWPHAYCRHPLKHLRKISFDGFGFQRLTLFFQLPGLRGAIYAQPENGLMSAFDYTYVIFTCNQHDTIKLLQCLQEAAKEACPNEITSSSSLEVENDNSGTLRAISRALARTNFTDDILHYQIVFQYWDNKDYSNARRSIVLTNSEVFLFHETYAGDLSACSLEEDISDIHYGDISMRTIKKSPLQDIDHVSSAKDDTKIVTIAFKSQSRLSWSSSSWLLKCQNVENAERLISDIRKALSS